MSVSVPAGVLQDLLTRVATLEQQAKAGMTAEQLNPNYLTVNPAGQVGANFTGLINALGLVLPAGTQNNVFSNQQVQWQRQSDGAVVASLGAAEFGVPVADSLYLTSSGAQQGGNPFPPQGISPASEIILNANSNNPGFARFFLSANSDSSHSSIAAIVRNSAGGTTYEKYLIKDDGTSDYVQSNGTNTAILGSANGPPLLTQGGGGNIGWSASGVTAPNWPAMTWAQLVRGASQQYTNADWNLIPGGSILSGIFLTKGWADGTTINCFGFNNSAFNLSGGSMNTGAIFHGNGS